jgi:hypothetical protein
MKRVSIIAHLIVAIKANGSTTILMAKDVYS